MADRDELERRVDALEDQSRELRSRIVSAETDAVAPRTLAAGADRDVGEVRAELRAHTSALNALRETQLEQGGMLQDHSDKLDRHEGMLHTVQAGVDHIIELLAPPAGSPQY